MNGSALWFALMLALAPILTACADFSAPSAGPTLVTVTRPARLQERGGAAIEGRDDANDCNDIWTVMADSSPADISRADRLRVDCERVGMANVVVIVGDEDAADLFHSASAAIAARR